MFSRVVSSGFRINYAPSVRARSGQAGSTVHRWLYKEKESHNNLAFFLAFCLGVVETVLS